MDGERLAPVPVTHPGAAPVAGAAGELDPELDPEATAMLLAAALDGLLFHRLVDPTLEVVQAAEPLDAMLGRPGAAPSGH